MRSRIFNIDWDKFDHRDPEQKKKLAGALQYFVSIPERFKHPKFANIQEFVKAKQEYHEAQAKARMQMFTAPADFPQSISPLIDKFHLQTVYDNGYEQIFDIRDFTGTKADSFSIIDVQSGLTFNQVLIGEKLKVYQMEGERATCYFATYGGALGWSRILFDDGQYWTIEDNAIEFRNKAYSTRAATFYALLEAAAAAKSACVTLTDPCCDDCSALAKADAVAFNAAAINIFTAVASKGYGVSPMQTPLVILSPLQLVARLKHALNVTQQQYIGSEKVGIFNFIPIVTQMLTNTNQFLVILPKYKLKGGYRMDLTMFTDFDILSYTDSQAGWMRFGGCIGDTDQIECIDATPPSGVC